MTLAGTGRGGAPGIVDSYRAASSSPLASSPLDELLAPDGTVKPASRDLVATMELLGPAGLLSRGDQIRRLVEDDGVTYGAPADGAAPGPWRLDPLPLIIDAQEWAGLALGLVQRAELLDLVLADLYGPRDLLRRGLLPAEAVLGHAGFLRACDGIRLPGASQLVMAGTDLVRGPGGWVALGDRTQAPSGAGYAMENRRIVSRVMPGLYRDTLLERLRSFFHTLRTALQELAPSTGEAPRVVILTPGATTETAFDQAFLSTLLGFPLVEGRDLTVREGRVYMRSLGRPEPVDVILRRVDGWFCDPLELRSDSHLGVAGLLQAARLGNVSIVNPPGSGVLENPALVPYLPALARELLGADLLLPSVPTWWCGDEPSRRHVLDRLGELVVRPIARGVGRANRFGWQLDRAAQDQLRRRIEAEPWAWSAQEPLAMSTAPVVTDGGLEPRRMVLRSFAVAAGGSWRLMSGGLARVAAEPGSLDVSSQAGALAKDVWVIGSRVPSAVVTVLPPRPAARDEHDVAPVAAGLSSRIAEDMFWLGRYAERAEDAARLLRVALDLTSDHGLRPGSVGAGSLAVLLRALTGVTTTYPGFLAGAAVTAPARELVRVATDPAVPGSLAHAVRRTLETAQGVRELLSTDTWLVLGSLDRVLLELGRSPEPDLHLQRTLSRVLEGLLAFSGLAVESMVRDAGWYVMDAGRRLERAIQLVALLRHTLAEQRPAAVDDLVLESVLIAAESVITYRRRSPGRPKVDEVLDLLLLERGNPRAVLFQLDRLTEDLGRLPNHPFGADDALGPVRAVQAWLREADPRELARSEPDSVARSGLAAFLDRLAGELAGLADEVARTHFARVVPPRPLLATPAGVEL